MRIFYFGSDHSSSTSSHRAKSLERLGHSVTIFNPSDACSDQLESRWLGPIHYRLGYRLLQRRMANWIEQVLALVDKPDLVWVNSGELLGQGCMQILKRIGCPIVLYNNDDPTGGRDGNRFDSLITAIPYYDLCAVLREINILEYKSKGAKRVLRVFMSYDEVVHQPYTDISEIPLKFRSEVAFIGTWMRHENRDKFLLELIAQGIPVSIWGGRWAKSPHWSVLKPYYRGGALGGRDYVAAIQGAKICLGLLSKGNRDLHTRRSVEVPFAGGLLCAERTSEHMNMYDEGTEAVFWSDASECADVCKRLLADEHLREKIKMRGREKVESLKVGNEDICREILRNVFLK